VRGGTLKQKARREAGLFVWGGAVISRSPEEAQRNPGFTPTGDESRIALRSIRDTILKLLDNYLSFLPVLLPRERSVIRLDRDPSDAARFAILVAMSEQRRHPTLSADAKLVQRIGDQGFADALDTAACLAVLAAGEGHFIGARYHKLPTARTTAFVEKSLVWRVLILVVRAYAPVRHADDRHTRVAFEKLDDAAVFAEVAATGSERHLRQARKRWDWRVTDPRWKRLSHYRDKRVAHAAERRLPAPLKTELVSFANSTIDMWAWLAKGVGTVSTFDLKTETNAQRQSAIAFWRAVAEADRK
jgi:hypothetical protein